MSIGEDQFNQSNKDKEFLFNPTNQESVFDEVDNSKLSVDFLRVRSDKEQLYKEECRGYNL